MGWEADKTHGLGRGGGAEMLGAGTTLLEGRQQPLLANDIDRR